MKHLIERLKGLENPRRQWGNLRHKLVDIVFIGLVSVVCGGTDYEHMEDTGYAKQDRYGQNKCSENEHRRNQRRMPVLSHLTHGH